MTFRENSWANLNSSSDRSDISPKETSAWVFPRSIRLFVCVSRQNLRCLMSNILELRQAQTRIIWRNRALSPAQWNVSAHCRGLLHFQGFWTLMFFSCCFSSLSWGNHHGTFVWHTFGVPFQIIPEVRKITAWYWCVLTRMASRRKNLQALFPSNDLESSYPETKWHSAFPRSKCCRLGTFVSVDDWQLISIWCNEGNFLSIAQNLSHK